MAENTDSCGHGTAFTAGIVMCACGGTSLIISVVLFVLASRRLSRAKLDHLSDKPVGSKSSNYYSKKKRRNIDETCTEYDNPETIGSQETSPGNAEYEIQTPARSYQYENVEASGEHEANSPEELQAQGHGTQPKDHTYTNNLAVTMHAGITKIIQSQQVIKTKDTLDKETVNNDNKSIKPEAPYLEMGGKLTPFVQDTHQAVGGAVSKRDYENVELWNKPRSRPKIESLPDRDIILD